MIASIQNSKKPTYKYSRFRRGGSIGFVGSGMYSRSAHIFSRSSRKVFEKSSARCTKEKTFKAFFFLCPEQDLN